MKLPTMLKRILLLLLVLDLAFLPAAAFANANIPGFYGSMGNLVQPSANQLPVIQSIVSGVSGLEQVGDNRLVVHQNDSTAVLDWQSFDIGANAWTHFDQQGNTDWSVLNRIYDQNPSQIFGRLTADGQVYLINQNGMLFSPGATVDVHSLAASALNIATDDFLTNTLTFVRENYMDSDAYNPDEAVVANHGTIATGAGGQVLLIAPDVENNGTIIAPAGRIFMTAGTSVEIVDAEQHDSIVTTVNIGGQGRVDNFPDGVLDSEMGEIRLYGRVVNHEGLIRAVTAVQQNGRILLKAEDTVTIGSDAAVVSAVSNADDAYHESFPFSGGEIDVEAGSLIVQEGAVVANGGIVNMTAGDRIYLSPDSIVDVSGNQVVVAADEQCAEVTLNSVELRDDYGQKDGLLAGASITISSLTGSSIGDISGSLSAESQTALERSSLGGEIYLNVDDGDIILAEGGILDISGGAITYRAGVANTTNLVSGTQVYDISDAPQYLTYDAILDQVSYGGANALNGYVDTATVGSDAGSIQMIAGSVILDGSIDGSVITSEVQNLTEELTNDTGDIVTDGRTVPTEGVLTIGYEGEGEHYYQRDAVVNAVTITGENDPIDTAGFDPTDLDGGTLRDGITLLDADMLTAANLSTLKIYTRTTLTIEEAAVLELQAGGNLTAEARAISNYGTLSVSAGLVKLTTVSNITSDETLGGESNVDYIPVDGIGAEQIYLAPGSLIDVSGVTLDYSATLTSPAYDVSAHVSGGKVILTDETIAGQGVAVSAGATLDMSGGYYADASGAITGGNAGSLAIESPSVLLAGTLLGHALEGHDGGTIDLHALGIEVVSADAQGLDDTTLAEEGVDVLVLADDRFEETGFTTISLESYLDLAVADDALLTPSNRVMVISPESDTAGGETVALSAGGDWVAAGEYAVATVSDERLGDTTLNLSAGGGFSGEYVATAAQTEAHQNARVTVADSAGLETAPGGTIILSGQGLSIGGKLSASAGIISLTAKNTVTDIGLTIRSGARILAGGLNLPVAVEGPNGTLESYEVLNGGSVTLTSAGSGSLALAEGSLIDVSAAPPVPTIMTNVADQVETEIVAGDPGTIRLAFYNDQDADGNTTLNGELLADATRDNGYGGTLIISKTDLDNPLRVTSRLVARIEAGGFDDLTLASRHALAFPESLDLALGRQLTLDTPEISGPMTSGQAVAVNLEAPRVVIENSFFPVTYPDETSSGTLSIAGEYISITGDVNLEGFNWVSLAATRDILLNDYYYDGNATITPDTLRETGWVGGFYTLADDLLLRAARIYTTTLSDFSIHTDGTLATLPSTVETDAPIYSAGGQLTVEASVFNLQGYLAAPMGTIILGKEIAESTDSDGNTVFAVTPADRIFMAPGSVLSTAGEASVLMGELDEDGVIWSRVDKNGNNAIADFAVEAAPSGEIGVYGDEVIAMNDSLIDVSGGGSIYTFLHQSGVEGTDNPLAAEGLYVILPDAPITTSENVVYLDGGEGVAAGYYSLLPAQEYAFVAGAVVIQDLGVVGNAATQAITAQGYATATGTTAVLGTSLTGGATHRYSIRDAEDVLAEGNFTVVSHIAGNGGDLTLEGLTTVLQGDIAAAALDDTYAAGTLRLAGREIVVGSNTSQLSEWFWITETLPEALMGKLYVAATTLDTGGDVYLGNGETTQTVTLTDGSTIAAVNLTITATDAIVLEDGAAISTLESGGDLALSASGGSITVGPDATLSMGGDLTIEAAALNFTGSLEMAQGELTLASDRLIASASDTSVQGVDGLLITNSLWQAFNAVDRVRLRSRSDLLLNGDLQLTASDELIIEATGISGGGMTDGAVLSADLIRFISPDDALETKTDLVDTGAIRLVADEIEFRGGDFAFDGFASVQLASSGDTVFAGKGSLKVEGNLEITAARMTTDYLAEYNDDGQLNASVADYQISAPQGTIVMRSSGGESGETAGEGGSLAFDALAIDHGGSITATGGFVSMTASGGGGIALASGSRIDTAGSATAPGGGINLVSQGDISVAEGAVVDVSAGEQGDAGSVGLSAAAGTVSLVGELKGQASGGNGGSIELDAATIGDLGPIIATLAAGGFDARVAIRAREGGLVLDGDSTLSAQSIRLTADGAALTIQGALDASSAAGSGSVALYAGTDLILADGSRINATGIDAGSDGGTLILACDTGLLQFANNAVINVGGGRNGDDGTVWFRARQSGSEVNMRLEGAIEGAEHVYAEAFRVYENIDTLTDVGSSGATIGTLSLETIQADIESDLDQLAWSQAPTGMDADRFHLVAGVEVRNHGDITVEDELDLSALHFGEAGEIAGALTIRAAGAIDVGASITDRATESAGNLASYTDPDSSADTWQLNLVAGADLAAARTLDVQSGLADGSGDLTIEDGVLVYSESGEIRLATGGDLNIEGNKLTNWVTSNRMYLSVGTFDQDITVDAAGDIALTGGIIQSSMGDIDVTVGGDLKLARKKNKVLGSIRTIGAASEKGETQYWAYGGGGDITVTTGGDIYGFPRDENWDAYTWVLDLQALRYESVWHAAYGTEATEGIAAMGGGSVSLRAGGDITTAAGTFRDGDLAVYAGGHIDGRYLVYEGSGTLNAMGSVGLQLEADRQAFELFDAAMAVTAQGDIRVGAIVNSMAAYDGLSATDWYLGYTQDTRIDLESAYGSITLMGNDVYHKDAAYRNRLLPATVTLAAKTDVIIKNHFYLAPAAEGNLSIAAVNGDIDGGNGNTLSTLYISDLDPDDIYGYQPDVYGSYNALFSYIKDGHAGTPVHAGDFQPAVISAGNDVKNLLLYSSKSVSLTAGNDVRNIYLQGQNVNATDVTTVIAGNDIYFDSLSGAESATIDDRGIEVGGPGLLYVQAGNNIDLGTTRGIQAIGALKNIALQVEENTVVVAAGTDESLTLETIDDFFSELREKGAEYSRLNAEGDGDAASAIVDEVRELLIVPLFGESADDEEIPDTGNIDMIRSRINTQGSEGDIYILAAGEINVGQTTWGNDGESGEDASSGVFTTAGGDINVFCGQDLNVNESRVMTFAGGDIVAWSDAGDINAGRGAKTAVNASDSHVEVAYDKDGNVISMKVIFEPPAVGSGIRTLTFDPDGVSGPETAPEAGDVYLFAPSGEIDAGEAGISGKNVILGATAILNAENIEVGGAAVGVPDTSASTGGLSALAGAGVVSESSKIAQEQAGLAGAQERFSNYVENLADTLVPKWIAVEVVGFGDSESVPSGPRVGEDEVEKEKRE